MIQIEKKEECCGCYGCTNICPKDCISMKIDNEGFGYPKVDESKCINCDLCEKVCPVISNLEKSNTETIAYACKNKNENVRLNSSSGGVFTLLSEKVISKNGVVFGASFDENFNVRHTYAESIEACIQFRGSKYVQSKIGDTYKKAKEFLNEGRLVLFSGTQCQIKGLNLYLRKKYDNLIKIDIVCHGVPSPKIFNMYKDKLVKRYQGEIKDIRFRDKAKGWQEFSYVTKFSNGKIHSQTLKEDIYMRGFLKDLYLRPSCYSCKAKNYSNGSDISLADYWKIENKHFNFYDNKGVSLVLVNSKKGDSILNEINESMDIIKTDLDYATQWNPCIVKSVSYNKKRERFFKEVNEENFEEIIRKYTKITFNQKLKRSIRKVFSKLIHPH